MFLPQCVTCKWFSYDDKCKAFPKGIPKMYLHASDSPEDNYTTSKGLPLKAHTEVDPDQVGDYVFTKRPAPWS